MNEWVVGHERSMPWRGDCDEVESDVGRLGEGEMWVRAAVSMMVGSSYDDVKVGSGKN